ncbi:hypothetical protein LshimejAT787_0112660 [Lyophyllum shimeji]|uniref:Uncharacterized protein n=1 Tax=Lyophyllum shimeji TaxID=47721 RepID=A0A9P3PFB4_LYOSH|nr:hypothetical protein LshimejAT787_0112660 [Lyophyllum shimeji]
MSSVVKRKQVDEDPPPSARKKPRPELDADPSTTSKSLSPVTTEVALQHALDFSSLNSTSTISERFDLVGHALLHDFHLVVQCDSVETPFEILELEFYLLKDGCHEDPFTHGSEEQKFSGRWYFHRAPRRSADSHRSSTSLTEYRGGSRKGMDLTLGGPASAHIPAAQGASSPQTCVRGGVLLRSLRRVADKKVISGPSLLVDEILRLSKTTSISELVGQKWANNTSAFDCRPASLFLRPRDTSSPRSDPQISRFFKSDAQSNASSSATKPTVYRSPRIGLDLSHPGTTASPSHPRVSFLPRPYRYFTHPELLTANGRPQTFLGVLRTCLDSTCAGQGLENPRLRRELVKITGLNESTVVRYLDHYKGGVDSGKLRAYIGAQGKGASSSPGTYLRMMGTLEQLRIGAPQAGETSDLAAVRS